MGDAGAGSEAPDPISAEAFRRACRDARLEIADSLHDTVVQSMTAMMMGLAVRSLDASPEVRNELATVELELAKVVGELRDVITGLRQPSAQS